MKKLLRSTALFVLFCAAASVSFAAETLDVWPDLAPGEKADAVKPTLDFWKPANQTSDSCVIVCPGGGYQMLCSDYEGDAIAQYFNGRGVPAVVLKYRVPRREGLPKHTAAWQDAQRAIRVVRSKAADWGIDPNKIGMTGFSAGGHLTLMAATTSQTAAYEPIDEIDKLPCNLNFAFPVYPAYVLEDGADGENSGKGNDSTMVDDFAFDAQTPPMCLFHGDADVYSPMGSVAVYAKLRKLNIPAELHIYANTVHGFAGNKPNDHDGDWLNRAYYWMQAIGF